MRRPRCKLLAPHRRGRDGLGVGGPPHEAPRPRSGAEVLRLLMTGSRARRAISSSARSASSASCATPTWSTSPTRATPGATASTWPWSCSRASRWPSASPAGRCRRPRRSPSPPRCAPGSWPRTRRGWCTAISSPENVFLARGPSGGDHAQAPRLRGQLGARRHDPAGEALRDARVHEPRAGPRRGRRRSAHPTCGRSASSSTRCSPGGSPSRPRATRRCSRSSSRAPYPPLPPETPAEARTVVAGCLAKDRADRYPTADALRAALDRALASLPPGDLAAARSGFFIEAGHTTGATSHALPGPAPTTTRTARFGLAIAILAVPLAVGVAAVATGIRARRASTGHEGLPVGSIGAPEPLPAVTERHLASPTASAEPSHDGAAGGPKPRAHCGALSRWGRGAAPNPGSCGALSDDGAAGGPKPRLLRSPARSSTAVPSPRAPMRAWRRRDPSSSRCARARTIPPRRGLRPPRRPDRGSRR